MAMPVGILTVSPGRISMELSRQAHRSCPALPGEPALGEQSALTQTLYFNGKEGLSKYISIIQSSRHRFRPEPPGGVLSER